MLILGVSRALLCGELPVIVKVESINHGTQSG